MDETDRMHQHRWNYASGLGWSMISIIQAIAYKVHPIQPMELSFNSALQMHFTVHTRTHCGMQHDTRLMKMTN